MFGVFFLYIFDNLRELNLRVQMVAPVIDKDIMGIGDHKKIIAAE